MCPETVKQGARLCRFCRYEFSAEQMNAIGGYAEVDGAYESRLTEIANFLLGQYGDARRLTPEAVAEIQLLLKTRGMSFCYGASAYELGRNGGVRYAYSDRELGRALREHLS